MKFTKRLDKRVIINVINSIISLKWFCQTLTPEYFQHVRQGYTVNFSFGGFHEVQFQGPFHET